MSVLYVSRERGRGKGRKESEEAELRIVIGKEHQGPTERAEVRNVDCHSGSLSLFLFESDCGEGSSAYNKKKRSLRRLLPTC